MYQGSKACRKKERGILIKKKKAEIMSFGRDEPAAQNGRPLINLGILLRQVCAIQERLANAQIRTKSMPSYAFPMSNKVQAGNENESNRALTPHVAREQGFNSHSFRVAMPLLARCPTI
jgi:hypothetical protein